MAGANHPILVWMGVDVELPIPLTMGGATRGDEQQDEDEEQNDS